MKETICSIQCAAHCHLGCESVICGHGQGGGILGTVYSSLGTKGASQVNNNPPDDRNNGDTNKDASSSDGENVSTNVS